MSPEKLDILKHKQGWELSKEDWMELALMGELTTAHLSWRQALAVVELDEEDYDFLTLPSGGRRLKLDELSAWGKMMLGWRLIAGDVPSFQQRLSSALQRHDLLQGNCSNYANPLPERGFTLDAGIFDPASVGASLAPRRNTSRSSAAPTAAELPTSIDADPDRDGGGSRSLDLDDAKLAVVEICD